MLYRRSCRLILWLSLLAAPLAHASDPSATPRLLTEELPAFLEFIEYPKRLAQSASDRLLALKCEAIHRERRRQDALLSEESGLPKTLSELRTVEDVAVCLLSGSPDPAPASVRLEMEASRQDFSATALLDFPSLSPKQRAAALKPFISGIAPSPQGVVSQEGRRLAQNALSRWIGEALKARDAQSLSRAVLLANTLMAQSLAAARADRWRGFQAETQLPVGLRLAQESPSFRGSPAPDPLRPLSSKTRALLEELWAFHWSYSRPVDNAQRSAAAPSGIPANRAEFFAAERERRARERSASPAAFTLSPSDAEIAESEQTWQAFFANPSKPPALPIEP